MEKSVPPWDEETLKNLNDYQQSGVMHPFTCRINSNHGLGYLWATPHGWVCTDLTLKCDYVQHWAHSWIADGSWREYQDRLKKALAEVSPPQPKQE
jgi:hypothetical protein